MFFFLIFIHNAGGYSRYSRLVVEKILIHKACFFITLPLFSPSLRLPVPSLFFYRAIKGGGGAKPHASYAPITRMGYTLPGPFFPRPTYYYNTIKISGVDRPTVVGGQALKTSTNLAASVVHMRTSMYRGGGVF